MKRYIVKRLLLGIVVVFIVSVLIFLATRASGDPVIMMVDPGASEAEMDVIRTELPPARAVRYFYSELFER